MDAGAALRGAPPAARPSRALAAVAALVRDLRTVGRWLERRAA
jgi:hypothetical protein